MLPSTYGSTYGAFVWEPDLILTLVLHDAKNLTLAKFLADTQRKATHLIAERLETKALHGHSLVKTKFQDFWLKVKTHGSR